MKNIYSLLNARTKFLLFIKHISFSRYNFSFYMDQSIFLLDFSINMELVGTKVQGKQISVRNSARFPYTTINLKQLSNILLPYHPSADNMAYTEQLWTIYDLDSSSVVLEENRLVLEPVINMSDIHYPLQEVNQDLVIQQTSAQYPGLLLKNNQQQQTLSDRQQNLGNLLIHIFFSKLKNACNLDLNLVQIHI